jgi:hypothetical protein
MVNENSLIAAILLLLDSHYPALELRRYGYLAMGARGVRVDPFPRPFGQQVGTGRALIEYVFHGG